MYVCMYVCLSKFILVTQLTYKYDSIFITFFPSTQYAYLYMFVQVYPCNTTYIKICYHIYMHIEWKEKNVILHIFMYNVMSDFSGARRVSEGRVNALVDAKRAKSFNNVIKMVAANVELTHQRLMTLENRTSMMAKAIMPALDDLKSRIAHTNQKLTSQYRMMQMAHHRYNLLFRWTHKMLTIHHFALLLFKNYLTIQVGTLQRIHHQYNRYESALDDTLIGIESLSSGYLTHHMLDPKTLSGYLEAIADNMEDTASDYEPVFTDIYQYYGNSLAPFTNTIYDLLLQEPILIKLKVQVSTSLYSVETAPMPLDAETYTAVK